MSPITRNRMKEVNVEDAPELPTERRTRRSIYITSNDGETVTCSRRAYSPVGNNKENVTTPNKKNKSAKEENCENVDDQGGATPKRMLRSSSKSKILPSSLVKDVSCEYPSPRRTLRRHSVSDCSISPQSDTKYKRNLNQDLTKSDISSSENDMKTGNEITSVKSKKLAKISEENVTKQEGETFSNTVEREEPLTTPINEQESFEATLEDKPFCEKDKKCNRNRNEYVSEVQDKNLESNERIVDKVTKRIINLERVQVGEGSSTNVACKCDDNPKETILPDKEKVYEECDETLCIEQKKQNCNSSEFLKDDANDEKYGSELHQDFEHNEVLADAFHPNEIHRNDDADKVHSGDGSDVVHQENIGSKVYHVSSDVPNDNDFSEKQQEDDPREVRQEDKASKVNRDIITSEVHHKDDKVCQKVQSDGNVSEALRDVDTTKFHQDIVNAGLGGSDANGGNPQEREDKFRKDCIEGKIHSIGIASDNEDEDNYLPSAQHAIASDANVEMMKVQTHEISVANERNLLSKSKAKNSTGVIIGDIERRHCQISEIVKDFKSCKISQIQGNTENTKISSEESFDKEKAERKKMEEEEKEIEEEEEKEMEEEEEKEDMPIEEEEKGDKVIEDEEEEEEEIPIEDEGIKGKPIDEEKEKEVPIEEGKKGGNPIQDEEEEIPVEEEEKEGKPIEDDEDDEKEIPMEEDEEKMGEEEEEPENRRRNKSRGCQFIDFEAEEGETDYEDEEEECEEEEDDDESNECESEEDSAIKNIRDYARKFLNDEAVDEDLHKRKRKRILLIQSDEEEDNTSIKELSTGNEDNDVSSIEDRKKKGDMNNSFRHIGDKIGSSPVFSNDDYEDNEETNLNEHLNGFKIHNCEEKDEYSGIGKQIRKSISKSSVVEKDVVSEGVLEKSYRSYLNIMPRKIEVEKMEIDVSNKETELSKKDECHIEEVLKGSKITEVESSVRDVKGKEYELDISKENSTKKVRPILKGSRNIGDVKILKKCKRNKDCDGKSENKSSKSKDFQKATLKNTSPKNLKKKKKKMMDIAVCNEETKQKKKGKCFKEILDTNIPELELHDKNINEKEYSLQTFEKGSVKKQKIKLNKSKRKDEGKHMEKFKLGKEFVASPEASKDFIATDKMLVSPENEFVVPKKKQKLLDNGVKNKTDKKIEKCAKSNSGQRVAEKGMNSTEVESSVRNVKGKEYELDISKENSTKKVRPILKSSRNIGDVKILKKCKRNKDCDGKSENKSCKSEDFQKATLKNTSPKNLKKKKKKMDIAVCNEETKHKKEGKCFKEILDTNILELELHDKNINEKEYSLQTFEKSSVKKQKIKLKKSKRKDEGKHMEKFKLGKEFVTSPEASKDFIATDKMLASPKNEFVVPKKKQKLLDNGVKNKTDKKIEKCAKSNSGHRGAKKGVNKKIIKKHEEELTWEDVRRRIVKFVTISKKWDVTNKSPRKSKISLSGGDTKEIKETKLKEKFFWNDSNWVVSDIYSASNCEWIVTNHIRKQKKGSL